MREALRPTVRPSRSKSVPGDGVGREVPWTVHQKSRLRVRSFPSLFAGGRGVGRSGVLARCVLTPTVTTVVDTSCNKVLFTWTLADFRVGCPFLVVA